MHQFCERRAKYLADFLLALAPFEEQAGQVKVAGRVAGAEGLGLQRRARPASSASMMVDCGVHVGRDRGKRPIKAYKGGGENYLVRPSPAEMRACAGTTRYRLTAELVIWGCNGLRPALRAARRRRAGPGMCGSPPGSGGTWTPPHKGKRGSFPLLRHVQPGQARRGIGDCETVRSAQASLEKINLQTWSRAGLTDAAWASMEPGARVEILLVGLPGAARRSALRLR